MRYIYLLLLAVVFTSCAKEFRNPYDPATPPDIWMPKAFKLDTLGTNALRLSWNQDERHIDGFAIQKSTNGQLKEILLPLDSLRYTDTQAVDTSSDEVCPELSYKVMARAGNNRSLDIGTTSGIIMPISSQSYAGSDRLVIDQSTTVQLNAQAPNSGEQGIWTIVSGTGGSFSNINTYNSNFNGTPCTDYVLRWTKSGCTETFDEVIVKFRKSTTTAFAGANQTIISNATQVTLAANAPTPSETGTWSIVNGVGGSFTNANSATSTFSGNACTSYSLRWTINGLCSSNYDDVAISFSQSNTIANAGPDQTLTNLTTTLAANSPLTGQFGIWSIVSGTGGSFSNTNSPTAEFTGLSGQSYTLKWTISTCSNSSNDLVNIFPLFTIGSGVTDIDGNVYPTSIIGTQEWMGKNLRTTKYANGNAISYFTSWPVSITSTSSGYGYYNNSSSNNSVYGKLYNWYAATDSRNVCPTGWHVPSKIEWNVLFNYLSSDEAGKLKETGTSHWLTPNTGATNSLNFTAVPGGYISSSSSDYMGQFGYYLSTTTDINNYVELVRMSYDSSDIIIALTFKYDGYSIRCLKN